MGGAVYDSCGTTIDDLVALQQQGIRLVVVHGGANLVTSWLSRQGAASKFVRGERVTDAAALEVVIAVLAGLVNKEIVAAINSSGGRAVGVSGVDGALVQGRIKNAEMGYMGSVVTIDTSLLEALLKAGFIPVVSPVSLHLFDKPEGAPRMLNINGDPVAGEIAAAIGAERLLFLTDVAGISDRSGRLLPRLSSSEVASLIDSGVATGGMIPKINACLRALSGTAVTRIIDGRYPHALLGEMKEGGGGTTIYK